MKKQILKRIVELEAFTLEATNTILCSSKEEEERIEEGEGITVIIRTYR